MLLLVIFQFFKILLPQNISDGEFSNQLLLSIALYLPDIGNKTIPDSGSLRINSVSSFPPLLRLIIKLFFFPILLL